MNFSQPDPASNPDFTPTELLIYLFIFRVRSLICKMETYLHWKLDMPIRAYAIHLRVHCISWNTVGTQ